jgi:hypothetical protein
MRYYVWNDEVGMYSGCNTCKEAFEEKARVEAEGYYSEVRDEHGEEVLWCEVENNEAAYNQSKRSK